MRRKMLLLASATAGLFMTQCLLPKYTELGESDGSGTGGMGGSLGSGGFGGEEGGDCEGDAERTIPCGLNARGSQDQLCTDDGWMNEGDCEDPDECEDGVEEPGESSCGGLNNRATFTRVCSDGMWEDTEDCIDPDECEDDQVEQRACAGHDGFLEERTCVQGTWQSVCRNLIYVSRGHADIYGNDDSNFPHISGDGNRIVFSSFADNLVADDTNNESDIFLRDLAAEQTQRVSTSGTGMQSPQASGWARISRDGAYVSFRAYGTDIGDDGIWGVFRKDVATGAVARLSASLPTEDWTLDNINAEESGLSADGSFGLYARTPTGGGFGQDLYSTVIGGETTRWTMSAATMNPGDIYYAPQITADGAYGFFSTSREGLVAEDDNGLVDVFRLEFSTGLLTLVNASFEGDVVTDATTFLSPQAVSADGRYVVFASDSAQFIDESASSYRHIYRRDMVEGVTTRISKLEGQDEPNGTSTSPSISGDGRYVAFRSEANNLVPDDTNGVADVFVADTSTGRIVRVSKLTEEADAQCLGPTISADGSTVAFSSASTTLFAGANAEGYENVFAVQLVWP